MLMAIYHRNADWLMLASFLLLVKHTIYGLTIACAVDDDRYYIRFIISRARYASGQYFISLIKSGDGIASPRAAFAGHLTPQASLKMPPNKVAFKISQSTDRYSITSFAEEYKFHVTRFIFEIDEMRLSYIPHLLYTYLALFRRENCMKYLVAAMHALIGISFISYIKSSRLLSSHTKIPLASANFIHDASFKAIRQIMAFTNTVLIYSYVRLPDYYWYISIITLMMLDDRYH